MDQAHQQRLARWLFGLAVALGLAWLARVDYSRQISTDVLDLIPVDERSPELALVRSLASERQARVALFVLHVPARTGETADAAAARRQLAARVFTEALARAPAFAEVVRLDDAGPREALGKYVFQRRLDLLLPSWLEEQARTYAATRPAEAWPAWLAGRTAAELENYLGRPEAMALEQVIAADPLLLVPNLLERVETFSETGLAGGPRDRVLVWALAAASPLREEGQQPVFDAVASAEAALSRAVPEATLQWTAISRLAAESRRRIQAEMSSLNLLSLVAVLGVAALCVRQVLKSLHLAPVVLCSLLGAWVATLAVFDRVHVLVFVVGSLLGGVAIDYGFYLYLQPARREGERYADKVRRLLKPLLASALTTILGFSLLLFSELPLIRHLGVFVSAGLLSALAAALLWFAQVRHPYLESRRFINARIGRPGPRLRLAARALLLIAAGVAIAGPWRLQWRDDIRELDIPAHALRANDHTVRAAFGEDDDRALYLTHGDSPAAARTALDIFTAWHRQAHPQTPFASLGLILPSPEALAALPGRRAGLVGFPDELQAALARHGFEPDAFAPFFSAWRDWAKNPAPADFDALAQELTATLRGPMALLMATEPGASWFATVAGHAPGAEPPPQTATVSASQLESLNRLFSRYRSSALRLSAFGLGLVGASVFALYGFRRGARIFALPAGACLFAFGMLGLAGQTLNLFHLLGAFLGVCLSHNYAIFSAENAARGESVPPSIRLSALTTSASFGVLALSAIPVVSALGATVALIVLAALAGVELEALARAGSPPAPRDVSPL
ncbi:MAG TPA: MMPL family transporter [Opitutaceae bacterium]